MVEKRGDFLLEVSWEVCNKVGGIHTVITSKATCMKHIYGDNYFFVGPYIPDKAKGTFEEKPINEGTDELCNKEVSEELKKEGIIIHSGVWLIDGAPKAILIDFLNWMPRIDEIKKWLWENYKVDSLRAGPDYNEVVVWAYCVGKLIESIAKRRPDSKIVAQFHEWLAGTGLLYAKKKAPGVATVFTTHATILGRTLVSGGTDIYSDIKKIDPLTEAYNQKIEAKHMVEMNSAQQSDAFTTVSEITGIEAQHFLGREPDVLLPNGLDIESYKTFEWVSIEHRKHREEVREFLFKYFFPYYKFNIRETLFFFTACRYEYKVKGIDILIEALAKLNNMIKKTGLKKTIITFFFVPAGIRGIKKDVLQNVTSFKDIKDEIEEHISDIKSNLMFDLISKRKISKETLFSEDMLLKLKKKVMNLSRKGVPPVSTHDLVGENDPITQSFIQNNLLNKKEDKVKVILYPIYLTGADGLLDLEYNQAILSSHLGIFPSQYEPWGYTTPESCALGVASITTDLSGFGRFIVNKVDKEVPGVYILKRMGEKHEEVVDELAKIMFDFTKLHKNRRVENKMAARKIAELTDWNLLVGNYIKAHNLALEKK